MSKQVVQRHFEDVSVDSTGTVVETTIQESKLVGVELKADDTADYALDVSPNGGNTYFNSEEIYKSTDEVRDVFEITDRTLRLRVTAAASNGTTADIFIDGVR